MMQMLPDLKRCIWRWDLRISVVGSMDWQRSYAFSLSLILTTKIHCFFSVEEDVTGSKHCSGKVMVFSLCTRDSIMVHSGGPVRQMRLFDCERYSKAKNHTAEQRKQFRLEKEKPILEAFWNWLDQQRPNKGTRLAKAVNYACGYMH